MDKNEQYQMVPFKTIEWIFKTGQMLQQLSIRVIHVLAKYT